MERPKRDPRGGDLGAHAQSLSRVSRSHEQARENYDRISRWYDLLEGNWERPPKETALARLGIRDGDRILEIGCGTGQATLELAHATGRTGKVWGVDLSPRMLQVTRTRIEKAELGNRIALENADATRLPLSDNSFDLVFMSFVLELFDTPEIPIVLAECRRVLRAGGRIATVSLSRAGGANWMRNAYEWAHAKFPTFIDCRPILVKEALEQASFQILEALLVSLWGLPVEIVIASRID